MTTPALLMGRPEAKTASPESIEAKLAPFSRVRMVIRQSNLTFTSEAISVETFVKRRNEHVSGLIAIEGYNPARDFEDRWITVL